MVGHAKPRGDRIKLHFYLCEKCDLSIIVSELSSDWTIIPIISAIGFFRLICPRKRDATARVFLQCIVVFLT